MKRWIDCCKIYRVHIYRVNWNQSRSTFHILFFFCLCKCFVKKTRVFPYLHNICGFGQRCSNFLLLVSLKPSKLQLERLLGAPSLARTCVLLGQCFLLCPGGVQHSNAARIFIPPQLQFKSTPPVLSTVWFWPIGITCRALSTSGSGPAGGSQNRCFALLIRGYRWCESDTDVCLLSAAEA